MDVKVAKRRDIGGVYVSDTTLKIDMYFQIAWDGRSLHHLAFHGSRTVFLGPAPFRPVPPCVMELVENGGNKPLKKASAKAASMMDDAIFAGKTPVPHHPFPACLRVKSQCRIVCASAPACVAGGTAAAHHRQGP